MLVIAVTLTLSSVGTGLALGFLSLGSLAIFALAQQQRYSFAKRHRDYQEQLRKYEQKVAESHKPENVEEYRRQEVRKALNQTIPHDGENSQARTGRSEPVFRPYLNRYFPGQIYTNRYLNIPNSCCSYTPDFAYIDREINLFIDIEIDEPYTYNEYDEIKPIHYVGRSKDENRNKFFNNNRGWIVIRFSEEQVVRYPHSCCKFIAQQIAEITRNSPITSQFAQTPDLQPQQQWTEKEAIEMAKRKKRDDYL